MPDVRCPRCGSDRLMVRRPTGLRNSLPAGRRSRLSAWYLRWVGRWRPKRNATPGEVYLCEMCGQVWPRQPAP